MLTPILQISLPKIFHNLLTIKSLCQKNHTELTPITKVIMGDPKICRLYASEIDSLGDSRISDIKRMRDHDIPAKYMLIRSPSLSKIKPVVDLCDCSLNTELSVLSALNEYCKASHQSHKVLLMIEIGDLREGILPETFSSFLKSCLPYTALDFIGIGCNATCFAGLIPTPDNLQIMEESALLFQQTFGFYPPYISGGGSNLLPLLEAGTLPTYINHLRIGESIVMGVNAIDKKPVQNCFQDCFVLMGEIIELKRKPSLPKTPLTCNAFGEKPVFLDRGFRKRAIVDIGRLDTDVGGIRPIVKGIEILGASSDHLILDVEEVEKELHVGDQLFFSMNYSALLYSMSSDYVDKHYNT